MTGAERRAALEAIAAEVRACTRCRLHAGRSQAVPGEGNPDTEVVFVGEGPGFNEDRLGRPFVGRAGDLLVDLLGSIGWHREDVFITNIVKCRPPENRDPQPDEVAACTPYLERQLAALDPALIVTLGRHSMARFMPGTTITRAHGTLAPADAASGAPAAMVYAMYHPAAALRAPDVERASRADAAGIPAALMTARARRDEATADEATADEPAAAAETAAAAAPDDLAAPPATDGLAPTGPIDPVPVALLWEETAAAAIPAGLEGGDGRAIVDSSAPQDDAQLTLFG